MTAPVLAGFHPDPSVVLVDGVYHLVTSSFEYLPGLPVHRSTDLRSWAPAGHVLTRPEQARLDDVPTPGGAWAPTIRHHDGVFHAIVTVMLGGRGCVHFTATDPAGPWSDGTVIDAVTGIDPDLAWDDDGTACVTFAGHPYPLRQVRVDLASGRALEEPRPVWAGSGLFAPEGPHLHRRDGWWYLFAAEGGTDRGHAVTVARSRSPRGPFETSPLGPVITARSTGLPVQNLGHADLVRTPTGGDALVLLGVRPVGLAQAFSPLGRETFLADVTWTDGWPTATLTATPATPPVDERIDLHAGLDGEWVSPRRTPAEVASVDASCLVVAGDGTDLRDRRPRFVGRRQRHLDAELSAVVDTSGSADAATGGIALRLDEDHHVAVESGPAGVLARATLAGLVHEWPVEAPAGRLRLGLTLEPPSSDFRTGQVGGDRVRLWLEPADGAADRTVLAELDGRYWTYEVAKSFTGRVLGVYATSGTVRFSELRYAGSDPAP